MEKNDLIFVAGHKGMVGSAIFRALKNSGYQNLITKSRQELPLNDKPLVDEFFLEYKPKYVFLAAAKVGGIIANSTYGADFIRENLQIQTNVIDASFNAGVEKLLFLGSSCIYPKFAEQPIQEYALLTGPLEETNLPYAAAKIAGKVMCDAYRKQHGFDGFTVMPSNVYGYNDNFHPEHSHVVAGMMRRFHEAKISGASTVTVWGTGKPMRELIFVDDLADACVFLMENYKDGGMINVGSSEEISIKGLAYLMAEIIGFKGDIEFDKTKPDGTPRKIMNNDKIFNMGWKPKESIQKGLKKMYDWWLKNKSD